MISLIAAIGINGELGKNNHLIWNLPGDLKFFKEITTNHKVIMGYNTYLSIGRVLPNRVNIVLCHDVNLLNNNDLIVYDNIDKLIANEITKDEEVFIIGGASLYNYFYPLANNLYLTLINETDNNADVYFPKIEEDMWNKELIDENIENNIKYKHVLYRRKD